MHLLKYRQHSKHEYVCVGAHRVSEANIADKETQVWLVSWGGVRLSQLGTSASNWRIVPAPDER
jgi:hypothetical protein